MVSLNFSLQTVYQNDPEKSILFLNKVNKIKTFVRLTAQIYVDGRGVNVLLVLEIPLALLVLASRDTQGGGIESEQRKEQAIKSEVGEHVAEPAARRHTEHRNRGHL